MNLSARAVRPPARGAEESAEAYVREFAERSGVVIRQLHEPREMSEASRLLADIWHVQQNKPHIDPGLLMALAHADNYVGGAYLDDRLVAICVGFFHPPSDRSMHSHIAGVADALVGSGVGKALKQDQRAWCLRRGVDTITWTFDPLIARNAYFNIHRLGTAATEYLPDFYGPMSDGINRGQPSDRMMLVWDLRGEPPTGSQPDTLSEPHALRIVDAQPVLDLTSVTAAASCCVQIPSGIERLRLDDPELSARWRLALRDALVTLMGDGWRIADFTRDGRYCLEKTATV